MATPTRIFIDYWNFVIQWMDHTSGAFCDWTKLPTSLAAAAQAAAQQLGPLKVEDIRVYASINPAKESKVRRWLDGVLDRQPGFRVFIRERQARVKPVHCGTCGVDTPACPSCSSPFVRAIEKGVDSAIITDMFALAWEEAYEVAILVSGDSDLVPAVEEIQDRGLKVVNATWSEHGHQLAKACWASFQIDPLIPQLIIRKETAQPAPAAGVAATPQADGISPPKRT